ncbi:MAG TPA: S53 family peptidase [Rhizomicrobium sp.]|nr:S53 family peptidase [Rhizomicrobium sp.]
MHRILVGGLVSAFVALGFAAGASAGPIDMQRSGNVFHAATCGQAAVGHARCHARIVTNKKGQPFTATLAPVGGYGPADLRSAYKVKKKGLSTTIIAAVDAFGYNAAEADLGTYRTQFGLPACTTANGCFKKLNQQGQQGNYPAQNTGWAQESALDIDMLSAMCPNCQVWLVEANTNSFSDLAAAVVTAHSLGAHVISNSYGGGEVGSQSFESKYTYANTAVTTSTGDHGFAAGPQFPATSPHVIAVGGTHLTADGSARGWTESAWSGAGSGCSTVYPKPAWQHDASCSKRMEADVSAVADPATGVAVYGPVNASSSGWLVFGGTSVSAPLVGGVYGVNGKKVKYGSNPYKHTANLFDVTTGSNGTCGGSYFCTAVVGYDGPTGLGTPNGIKAF